MSKKDTFMSLTKNSKGELIFEVNPEAITAFSIIKGVFALLLKIFLPIFSIFDFLASRRKLVISSIGLGIGLGISVLVTQRPDTIQAFPDFSIQNTQTIRVQRVIIPSIDLSAPVVTGSVQDLIENINLSELVHDNRSAGLGSHQPVVIADVGVKNILVNLELIKIGDDVTIQGTNNANYNYRVIEIRDMKAEYLPNVIGAQDETLIIYKAKNIFRTQLYMVIAKPVL